MVQQGGTRQGRAGGPGDRGLLRPPARATPSRSQDDLLSQIIRTADTTGDLDPDELLGNAIFLFPAGFPSTSGLIGNGLLSLLRHATSSTDSGVNPGCSARLSRRCCTSTALATCDSGPRSNLSPSVVPTSGRGDCHAAPDSFDIGTAAGSVGPSASTAQAVPDHRRAVIGCRGSPAVRAARSAASDRIGHMLAIAAVSRCHLPGAGGLSVEAETGGGPSIG